MRLSSSGVVKPDMFSDKRVNISEVLRYCVQIPLELTGVFLGSGSLIQFINLQFVVVDARFLVHIAKTH